MSLPALADYRPTRDALHAYSRLLGGVRRQLAPPHPRWWHISLGITESGFSTGPIPLDDASLELRLDLAQHRLVASLDDRRQPTLDLTAGLSASQMGRQLLEGLAEAVPGDLSREPWEDDEPTHYRPTAAADLHRAFSEVARAFESFRRHLPAGGLSPVQLWPHHFDLSFEWLGGRTIEHEEDGRRTESPAQIGFGFSTGDEGHPRPYFYANPWPFEEDELLDRPLPEGARWHTEGWQGGLLPYDTAVEAGLDRLIEFVAAVDRAARPRLSRSA